LRVSTGNMEDGSFRCDANISIRPEGSNELFTRVEIKNMNSLRSVYRALEYEKDRQIEVVKEGGRIIQETRGWSEEKEITVSQRTKEDAHDYRYFPEPDLPPISFSLDWLQEIKLSIPELPEAKRGRFMTEYGLTEYDAALLTSSNQTAKFFEEAVDKGQLEKDRIINKAKIIANWMLGDFFGLLNSNGVNLYESKINPTRMREFTDLVDTGIIRGPAAKSVLEHMFNTGQPPADIAHEQGLTQIEDDSLVEEAVNIVIKNNPQAVQDYVGGKETAVRFLLGQVMKETRGRVNPGVVMDLLIKELQGMEG
jgi:aspartyl-tRNA(Asn)/glutamyl-tRNA(Gln) amidotransferase subunit B